MNVQWVKNRLRDTSNEKGAALVEYAMRRECKVPSPGEGDDARRRLIPDIDRLSERRSGDHFVG